MNSTKKEFEDFLKSHAKLFAAVNVLVRLLQPIVNLGFMRRLLGRLFGRTVAARVGTLSKLEMRGEHERAADMAIELLKENRHKPSSPWRQDGQHLWWCFMFFAVKNLHKCDDQEKKEEMIELGRNGVEPFQGWEVANSFLHFAIWKYREGDYDAAIELAEIAANADDTNGEPDFYLGWYCLAQGGDAMGHFTRAVDKEPQIISRIEDDTLCREHPQMIQKLKDISADNIVTEPDGPDATDRDDA